MKKSWLRITAALLLSVIIFSQWLSGYMRIEAHAAGEGTGSCYLYPFEEAVAQLEQLAGEQKLQAVVYLEDVVPLKTLPDENSETVKELVSGDVVQIIGVGQDADLGIWYEVTYFQETETVTGYLRRENLACVQEEFTDWESSYVYRVSVFGRRSTGKSYPDVEQFPQSYQNYLYQLKEQHPNWIFVRMNTGISWKTLVANQLGERSLIYASTSPDEWKNGMYGTNWAYASEKILKYYLDPRNFLNEKGIFQFELLGYAEEFHSIEAVNYILNGTFMYNTTIENGKTYAQNLVELGQTTKVSPFLMASRIRQEQGAAGTSALISGTYAGYEGYYNFYNIGASGKTDKEVIESGLEKAKKEGWDTRYKSLKAGAVFLGGSYIGHGQDTLYLQKFDVDNRYDGIFWHQYMQNIEAPYKEAQSVKRAYEKAGLLDSAYVFRIPVYGDMPASASVKPGEEDIISLSSTVIDNLQIDSQVTLHPFINGKEGEGVEWKFTSSDATVASVEDTGVVTALKTGTTTITCRKAGDEENSIAGTCVITVIKADIDVSGLELPKLEEIIYNPKQTLEEIALPEGYTWLNPKLVPTVKQGTYAVTYNPDESKYNSITLDVSLAVNKAEPTYVLPEGLQGGKGRELSSVLLPQGYSWEEPEQKLPETAGKTTVYAKYNPDIDNYETVEKIAITVEVICMEHSFGEWKITEATCEKDGVKQRSCITCKVKEEIVLPATGHLYHSEVIHEATETTEGERLFTCSNCQDTYSERIPRLPAKHEHVYEEEVIKKASCETEGLVRYSCSCKDSYEETIPALGHSMEADSCKNCGYKKVEEQKQPTEDKKEETTKPATGTPATGTPAGGTSAGGNSSSENSAGQNSTGNSTTGGSTAGSNTTANNTAGNSTTGSNTAGGSTTANNTVGNSTTGSNTAANNTSTNSTAGSNTAANNTSTNSTAGSNTATNNTAGGGTTGSNTAGGSAPLADKTTGAASSAASVQSTTNTSGTGPLQQPANSQEDKAAQSTAGGTEANGKEEERAGSNGEKIIFQLNENTEISRQLLEQAMEQNLELQIELPGGIRWRIDPKTAGGGLLEKIDMNVQLTEGIVSDSVLQRTARDKPYLEMRLAHEGDFGFFAILTIPVSGEYSGMYGNLFYLNSQTGEPEFQSAARVTEEGEMSFTFVHASDYLVVFDESAMSDADVLPKETELTDQPEETIVTAEQEEGQRTEADGAISHKLLWAGFILILLIAVLLIIAGIGLNRKKKEIDYLDEDVDDYREKSWEKED